MPQPRSNRWTQAATRAAWFLPFLAMAASMRRPISVCAGIGKTAWGGSGAGLRLMKRPLAARMCHRDQSFSRR